MAVEGWLGLGLGYGPVPSEREVKWMYFLVHMELNCSGYEKQEVYETP